MKKKSDAYLKVVEWSEEDQCYVGTCPGLMFGGVHGESERQVYKELCEVVEEWIEQGRKDSMSLPQPTSGKHYSGKFVLRVGEDTHKELSIRALQRGESLNTYCKKVLSESVI